MSLKEGLGRGNSINFIRRSGLHRFNKLYLPSDARKYEDVESKQLLWELIKMELRAKTMSYYKKKRAEVKK